MRSIWRTLDRPLLRDIALVCVADGVVGISFGAIAVGAGFDIWLPIALSLLVFAGAAQFLFVGIIAAGGSPLAALIAALLVNSRHFPFGLAVSDVLGSGLARIVGSHLITDESSAFTLNQHDPDRRRAAFWTCGVGIFVVWNVGVAIGALTGGLIDDTDTFGLDAAFPAVLLALVLPALRDRNTRRAAAVGAVIAVLASPWLPAGIPVLLALAGLATAKREGIAA